MKKEIETPNAPRPGGAYSQGLISGKRVYVSGARPVNPENGEIPLTVEEQAHQALRNISAILEAGGAKMDDVVKSTVHLANSDDFPKFDAVYREYFNRPYPVRTTVGSILRGILVEIDVIAEID